MVVRAALPRCTQKPAGCNRGSGMQWGRALLITSTARGTWTPESEAAATHAHTCRREARACAGLRGPGFAAGAEIAVLMPVPAGADLLAMVPAGVLQRRRIAVAWASAPGRRLETSVYFRI